MDNLRVIKEYLEDGGNFYSLKEIHAKEYETSFFFELVQAFFVD